MKKPKRKYLLPLWAYAILNLVFLGFVTGVYYGGKYYSEKQEALYSLTGVVPVLFVCYLAFTFACIYDAVFDRVSRRSNTVAPGSLSKAKEDG